jgi:hypothetical protein
MGINLAVVLGHSLQAADLLAFPERVLSSVRMQRSAERLWHVMRPRWPNLGLVSEFSTFLPRERLAVSDVMAAWEPGQDVPSFQWAGFNLYFGKRAVAAIHIEKLSGFVLDLDRLRSPLQMCAQALARELRSSTIIYGPDSFSPFQEVLCVEEGVSVAEIVSNAKRRCGVPAGSIREMADEAEELSLYSRCYYVEAIDLEVQ